MNDIDQHIERITEMRGWSEMLGVRDPELDEIERPRPLTDLLYAWDDK